ncbi:ABC transporter substrate binding protein [Geobacter sp. OR-1]|uniref:ABC transporter substrate-binding protein n=1 Tax=Geobacter sp. OR-1 TaxID=1266765 RepID=UPI0005433456|nr:ABC transporter substrate binding protein [Geobacter sp. OR-1]GAM09083.1 ABC transporter substrate binding protein [Geobacter sp. OR-1]
MDASFPHIRVPLYPHRHFLSGVFALIFFLLLVSPACAAKVLIVGDIQYALVADVVSEIQLSLRSQCKEYSIAEVKGKLGAVVDREDAQVVVALGMEALAEAQRLPTSVGVVYGLVVAPPKSGRANTTGVYMSPPVSEYVATLRRYLPSLSRVSVVGSQTMIKSLLGSNSSPVDTYHVSSSSDLVNTVNRLTDAKALLLLPDVNLLTASVMSNVYLFSFRKNIPLLGISEANVKQGSLFALVFDPKTVSRQIGEKVQAILDGRDAGAIPSSPPRKYHLYINNNSAHKMGIELPDEMLRKAKRIYQ